jgi:LmbE family N-acetylglucosaminyl deacetylase
MKTVMAIGAHPDDIEFGCAGTLIRHHESGDTIVYVCMTDTESVDGTTGEILRSSDQVRSETVAAAKEMGCTTKIYTFRSRFNR